MFLKLTHHIVWYRVFFFDWSCNWSCYRTVTVTCNMTSYMTSQKKHPVICRSTFSLEAQQLDSNNSVSQPKALVVKPWKIVTNDGYNKGWIWTLQTWPKAKSIRDKHLNRDKTLELHGPSEWSKCCKKQAKNGKVKNPRLTCQGNVAKAGPEGLQDSKEPLLKPCRQYTSIRIRRKETLIKKWCAKNLFIS